MKNNVAASIVQH